MNRPTLALSIKQPWITLLLHGLKSIEVRRWPTHLRGRVLLHAAKVPDNRPEGWELVTPAMRPLLDLAGGLVGQAHLVECRSYRSSDQFCRDQAYHLNRPEWFLPGLYGFVLQQVEPIEFVPLAGYVRFFTVPSEVVVRK